MFSGTSAYTLRNSTFDLIQCIIFLNWLSGSTAMSFRLTRKQTHVDCHFCPGTKLIECNWNFALFVSFRIYIIKNDMIWNYIVSRAGVYIYIGQAKAMQDCITIKGEL